MTPSNFQNFSNFIWSVADLLRGPYRPPQYERVMLPLTVLRRFDCVLDATKADVLKEYEKLKRKDPQVVDKILNNKAKDKNGKPLGFHNHSQLDFQKLKGDPDNIGRHLTDYINGFSENIRKIFEYFEFEKEIEKLEESNRLYQVISKFAEMDLHPDVVDNITMGLIFEDLIRRFNEAANETAGDHFTPREVIQLMVNLILQPDSHVLTQEGIVVTVCDPACGTGGMLAESQNWIRAHNDKAIVKVFGQDYNPRSYAVAASDLLIKGHKDSRIAFGNTLTDDKFPDMKFDYLLANPPFGVDWKNEKKEIERWPDFRGYDGKLPRINDGALLFLIHMISKFQPYEENNREKPGSRVGIVFNGSPLFTGGAGSGESEIRRWIIEHDWLEAIVALPEQMFYNTGIGTFIWIVSNRKSPQRKGKIQLIDARERYKPMKRSLGDKRRYLDENAILSVTREHGSFEETETSRIFDNTDFGYRRIVVQRPLRLRFELTQQGKEEYLDLCPEMLEPFLEIEAALGDEPQYDWNKVWKEVQHIVKEYGGWSKGKKGKQQRELFREIFTHTDPDAKPVIAKEGLNLSANITAELFPGQTLPNELTKEDIARLCGIYKIENGKEMIYEADSELKDTENIPLKEDILS
ncbi:MAG TPA: SAM-dependent DNA methyltransferase, partial [Epsilonproteobacteria bacterium]|nr:SAM-dependent DNA methyltransferase [Campylobacterota bacterium]